MVLLKPTLIPDTFNTEEIPPNSNVYDFTQLHNRDEKEEDFVVAKLSLSVYQQVLRMLENREKQEDVQVKGSWTAHEDKLLLDLVEKHGARRWSHIAKFMKGRVGKQCRERYLNHLDPRINKGDWSEEEDQKIMELHEVHGNQWAKIARQLEGRTANSVKNHWNSTLRRKIDHKMYQYMSEENSPHQEPKMRRKRKRQPPQPRNDIDTDFTPESVPESHPEEDEELTGEAVIPSPVQKKLSPIKLTVDDPDQPPRKRQRLINLAAILPSPQNLQIQSPAGQPINWSSTISPKNLTLSSGGKYKQLYLEVDQLPTPSGTALPTTLKSTTSGNSFNENFFLQSPAGVFVQSPKEGLFSPANAAKDVAWTSKLP